jgi:hypothetical protein
MTMTISDLGVTFNSGNVVDLRATMPTLGSYVAGDIVLEVTASPRVSGWKRQTTGSTHILGTDWIYFSGNISLLANQVPSGTSVTFPDLPVGTKRIKVSGVIVSTSGTSDPIFRIGPAGGVETSGYNGVTETNGTRVLMGAGFQVCTGILANSLVSFTAEIHNSNGFTWVFNSTGADQTNTTISLAAGYKTIASTGVKLTLTTLNGTDTFDGGRVVIETESF